MSIPCDVILDVLLLLPVKSILRFRSLSKYFCRMIDCPTFIDFHLNHSSKTGSNRSLMVNDVTAGTGSIYQIDLDSPGSHAVELALPFQRVPFPLVDGFKPRCGEIFGSCNGLVALRDDEGITLWNPSTAKHRAVPKFWTGFVWLEGFGYDAIAKDYKAIIISKEDNEKHLRVMVYSLKADSWRRIEDLYTPTTEHFWTYYPKLYSALVGSSLHWAVVPRSGHDLLNNIILAFDLSTEKFREVPSPKVEIEGVKILKKVMELGGCLSLTYDCHHRSRQNNWLYGDIWIMKKYGVESSWTRLFTIPFCFYPKATPLCFTNKGDKVLLFCEDGIRILFFWYDLKSSDTQRIFPFRLPGTGNTKYVCVTRASIICTRSLVPLHAHV
ncbi:F-box protein CPR1-like [Mercurialis annua]|uniref:F-box protein CPR1-like n=1 Tax=Mercurialis annua TaxID=3986 RepID=UPI00215F6E35|nr:F-box protein CPR1-like [Mercurialis annua]